jgi:phosphatidylserine/phosphatidylglycerophosphate/cardiolipin synthase-like enzyme
MPELWKGKITIMYGADSSSSRDRPRDTERREKKQNKTPRARDRHFLFTSQQSSDNSNNPENLAGRKNQNYSREHEDPLSIQFGSSKEIPPYPKAEEPLRRLPRAVRNTFNPGREKSYEIYLGKDKTRPTKQKRLEWVDKHLREDQDFLNKNISSLPANLFEGTDTTIVNKYSELYREAYDYKFAAKYGNPDKRAISEKKFRDTATTLLRLADSVRQYLNTQDRIEQRHIETQKKLSFLENKYLLHGDNAPLIFSQNSEITPIIDGVNYFQCVHNLISVTKKDDLVFIAGWGFMPDMDIQGKAHNDPNRRDIADLLVEKAADGVDVRLILAGGPFAASLPGVRAPINTFRNNLLAAKDLRSRMPSTREDVEEPPLKDRVLLDSTGALLGSNHQKVIIVSIGGKITALVGSIDCKESRYDQSPHRALPQKKLWGWHDAAALITGPAAKSVLNHLVHRWQEVSTLPKEYVRISKLKFVPMNPSTLEAPKTPEQSNDPDTVKSLSEEDTSTQRRDQEIQISAKNDSRDSPEIDEIVSIQDQNKEKDSNSEVSIQILRSFGKWKKDSLFRPLRESWSLLPKKGVREVYQCITKALGAASRYIYIEDQYCYEAYGGNPKYEIYPFLVAAAKRGVKVILVRAGTIAPKKKLLDMNSSVNQDIQKKVLDPLTEEERRNVVLYQVEHTFIHTKLILIDDEFASIGSANLFSRSMAGIDHELNVVMVTTGSQVQDLRTKLWAEHLRLKSPEDPENTNVLNNLDRALGIWCHEWCQEDAPPNFERTEDVLTLVAPKLGGTTEENL